MIVVALTELKLTNATETMVWVDFLSTTEINLGIICVSIPMLGPVFQRLTGRGKNGSKLSGTPKFSSYERSVSRSTRPHKSRPDETIGLDTIYANNLEDSHNVTILTNKDHSENDSQAGSDEFINKSADRSQELLHDGDPTGRSTPLDRSIMVQSQWEVRHA